MADGSSRSGPATEPIWIQSSARLRSLRRVKRAHGPHGGLAPQVVEDDVDVRPDGERVVVERDRGVSPEVGQRSEASGVAPRPDHLGRAEEPGDLDGHPTRVAGRAEDEDPLPGGHRDPPAQRDPRGHRRIHRGGDRRRVAAGARRMLRRRSTAARSAIDPRVVSGRTK